MWKLWSEEEKFRTWAKVEWAVAKAQEEMGIIPKVGLSDSLAALLEDEDFWRDVPERVAERERIYDHDVLAFLSVLEESLGRGGNYLHFGMTSSDVVDTANALRMRKALLLVREELLRLAKALYDKAQRYKYSPVMGRTHGVFAQPTTFGLKFLGFYSEALRDLRRLDDAIESISYGKISGAVGNYALNPPEVEERALALLGLKVEPVSTQVVPRDRFAHALNVLMLVGELLERLALEIRLSARTETGEMAEPFRRGQRGSSAMPHKRNPIRSERLTGIARLLRGWALAENESVALWHERDISHSSVERFTLADATTTLHYALGLATSIVEGLVVNEDRARENMERFGDFYLSSVLLLLLVRKGVSRDVAYEWVKEVSQRAHDRGTSIYEEAMRHSEIRNFLTEEELRRGLSVDFNRYVDVIFSRFGPPS
ncbi:MAG: adenylosuccinate lyase [Thermotogae bacterium]|nr:adenylosuccinate lyase [Thermotogota bacterium]